MEVASSTDAGGQVAKGVATDYDCFFPGRLQGTWAACRAVLPHAQIVLGYILEDTEATLD